MKKPKKLKKPNVSKLKKEADKIFSQYIRQRDEGRCFTCGVRKHWKEIQCGHYISRSHNSLRYDERNCNAQCVACNIFRGGALDSYALALIKKYGADILEIFAKEKRKIKQFTIKELQALIEEYKKKINETP